MTRLRLSFRRPALCRLGRIFTVLFMVALCSHRVEPQAAPSATTAVVSAQDPAAHLCDALPHADHPTARIGNRTMSAIVFLPDAERGYYRGSRFDWAGIVGCASLHGHTFFGEWFPRYDPLLNDAITGPVEEFRHPTSELGYDDAAAGGLFLKIGVGILRRIDNAPYRFGAAYPIVDHGMWSVKTRKRTITFRQELHSAIGYAYIYEKTLSFGRHGNLLTLRHRLRNIGVKPIDTNVYDHDFFVLDHEPTGPGMELHLPFSPVLDKPFPEVAQIDGNIIRFVTAIEPGHSVGAYITGYTGSGSHYHFVFEDKNRGLGVEQTSDSPMVKMYLWATSRTVCPEAYIGIHVVPGHAQTWTIHYRFFTP